MPPAATPSPSPTRVSPDVQIKCEDLPNQTYVDGDFSFSITCPSNFYWETFSKPYEALFLASALDARHTPTGISINIYRNDTGALRDWIAAHTGAPNSDQPRHFWASTSNLLDTRVAGRQAVKFATTSLGPGPPPNATAIAFVLPDGYMFLIGWAAYSTDDAAAYGAVAEKMVASIRV